MFGRRKANPIAGKIDTLIARSARVLGDVEFAGGLHLEGRVRGNVRCAADAPAKEPCTLWISEAGVVEGAVDVPSVVVNGTVAGDVVARERLVLGAQARITGNVQYGAIEMALGAQVSGKLMPIASGAKPVVAAGPQPAPAAPSDDEILSGSAGAGGAGVTAVAAVPGTTFDARRSGT
jgi:cytoskeletal protein CcmA (bactofilin family)